jgi:hypothetical protein
MARSVCLISDCLIQMIKRAFGRARASVCCVDNDRSSDSACLHNRLITRNPSAQCLQLNSNPSFRQLVHVTPASTFRLTSLMLTATSITNLAWLGGRARLGTGPVVNLVGATPYPAAQADYHIWSMDTEITAPSSLRSQAPS